MNKLPAPVEGKRAPRLKVAGKARLTVAERAFSMECQIVDISRSGVLVSFRGHLAGPFERGQRLELELGNIQDLIDTPLRCGATVARMAQVSYEDRRVWNIGLKFRNENMFGA